jgi:hypothetical protein
MTAKAKPLRTFRVLRPIEYPKTIADIKRAEGGDPCSRVEAEPGDIVSDIPARSLPWLLAQNRIEEVNE